MEKEFCILVEALHSKILTTLLNSSTGPEGIVNARAPDTSILWGLTLKRKDRRPAAIYVTRSALQLFLSTKLQTPSSSTTSYQTSTHQFPHLDGNHRHSNQTPSRIPRPHRYCRTNKRPSLPGQTPRSRRQLQCSTQGRHHDCPRRPCVTLGKCVHSRESCAVFCCARDVEERAYVSE